MAKGRPPLDEAIRKSQQLSVRIPAPLRDRLTAEAQSAGRSLSDEIVIRLRRSIEDKDRMGSPTTYWLFVIAGNQVRQLERFTGRYWWDDAYTHSQTKVLINTMLDYFKPSGRVRRPRKFGGITEPLGQHLAEREVANLEAALLAGDPPAGWNWGGMTVADWQQAAALFAGKLKTSPLAKLYGTERTKK